MKHLQIIKDRNNRKGKFTASNIYRLLAGGTGSTRLSYIYEVAADVFDNAPNITTKQMEHGKINQTNAFYELNKMSSAFNHAVWYDKYIPINDMCGASPDIICEGKFVADTKCRYTIIEYIERTKKISSSNSLQIQMQMMAANVSNGYLIEYLTRPEVFGSNTYNDYPFPIEDRLHIHELTYDEEIADKILKAVESNYPLLLNLAEQMSQAEVIDEDIFFNSQMYDKVIYIELKDINWQVNNKRVWLFGQKYYISK